MIAVRFPDAEWNRILAILDERPHRQVRDLIDGIVQQAAAAKNKAAADAKAAAEAEAAPAAEPESKPAEEKPAKPASKPRAVG